MNDAGNPWTDRPQEDVAKDAEMRLRVRCLKSLLKANAPERVIAEFESLLDDPLLKPRTKASVAKSYASYLKSLLPAMKQDINVNQSNVALTAADLLALAGGSQAELGTAQPQVHQALPTPEEPVSDAGSPAALGSGEGPQDEAGYLTGQTSDPVDALLGDLQDEPTEASPLALDPQAPARAPSTDNAKGDPTESLGDVLPSSSTQELDQ